ncbi:hypothetical protein CON36_32890 [Bacillus cereus]|uniref:Uncharacterized protein n=2 Tax=Bacillus cereus TaxID=1396 RepID=A0A9X6ST01_BACCE|nr:hypothetical protein CON36_32890 [Bacillus cereus]
MVERDFYLKIREGLRGKRKRLIKVEEVAIKYIPYMNNRNIPVEYVMKEVIGFAMESTANSVYFIAKEIEGTTLNKVLEVLRKMNANREEVQLIMAKKQIKMMVKSLLGKTNIEDLRKAVEAAGFSDSDTIIKEVQKEMGGEVNL